MISVQAPDVVRVLAGAAQRIVVPEIRSIHRGRLIDLTLFEQQGGQCMARWLHPSPGLVVGQVVVQPHGRPEVSERGVKAATTVLDLTPHHLPRDRENVETPVVEHVAALRDAGERFIEVGGLALRRVDVACHRASYRLGVPHHRSRHAKEIAVLRQLFRNDSVPFSEPDEYVLLH